MTEQKPATTAAKPADFRDEPCGPAKDDSGITNVGGSASGRREPHGCTHLEKSEAQKKKPAR